MVGKENAKSIDVFKGCLLGGAVGDALGYPVEFMSADEIRQVYGENGIRDYVLTNDVAQISDDTQMTLYTANGLLVGTTRGMTRGVFGSYPEYIGKCYRDWLKTQRNFERSEAETTVSWLNDVPELYAQRAPGTTCITALSKEVLGSIAAPINHSKGCGGVMRVAPIGLYFSNRYYTLDEIDMIGAEAAALTHGHELGYIPAAMLVHMIQHIAYQKNRTLLDAVLDGRDAVKRLFYNTAHLEVFLELIDKAVKLAYSDETDQSAICHLGEGWVAEEALTIAIFCALRYENNFEEGIIAAVNHSGDSDSTGAITGNILGAHLGIEGIPCRFLEKLELKNIIEEIAEDLFNDCPLSEYADAAEDKDWTSKYVCATRPKNDGLMAMKEALYDLLPEQIQFICDECNMTKEELFSLDKNALYDRVYDVMCDIEISEIRLPENEEGETKRCILASDVVTVLGNAMAGAEGYFDEEWDIGDRGCFF